MEIIKLEEQWEQAKKAHAHHQALIKSSFDSSIMTKKKFISSLPLFATYSLGKFDQPLMCSHSASKFRWHPHLGQSIPWQGFLASEDQATKAYTYLETIMSAIACSWKSMETIGYQCPITALLLKCITSIPLHVPISFVVVTNVCYQFWPPN